MNYKTTLKTDSSNLSRTNDNSLFFTLESGVWATPEANDIQDNTLP